MTLITWRSEHSVACPVTHWRERLLADLEQDPEDPYLLGAVPEYDEGGDQEAELCTCRPEPDPRIVRVITAMLPKRFKPW